MRACCLPETESSKLSRAITEAVNARAAAEVAFERNIQSIVTSSNNNNGSDDMARTSSKRRRTTANVASATAAAAAVNKISPLPPPSSSSATAQIPPNDYHISHLHDQFTAPYLGKGRKEGSHFRKKVEAKKDQLRKSQVGPITPVRKNIVVKKSRKSSLQQNTQWINESSAKSDHSKRFSEAGKKAISAFKEKLQGKQDSVWKSVSKPDILSQINKEYSLDGEGREGSREQGVLTERTVTRWVERGLTEPPKKGRGQKIDRNLLRLVALHANMCQVGMTVRLTRNISKEYSWLL